MEQFKEFNCVAIPNDLENHTLIFNYEVGCLPPSKISQMSQQIQKGLSNTFPSCKILVNISNDHLRLSNVKVEKSDE